MNLGEFREDLNLHSAGAPISIGDAVFFTRRWGTPESIKVRRACIIDVFGPIHRMMEGDDQIIWGHWLVEYGITGWENVFDSEGNEIKYSIQTARKIFTNPEYLMPGNIVTMLVNASMTFENYLFCDADEAAEELKK